jgi:hypothetical protein
MIGSMAMAVACLVPAVRAIKIDHSTAARDGSARNGQ